MKQTGYVTEVIGDKIKVRIIRGSACGGHCASCKGCPNEVHTIICDAYDGAVLGDVAELYSDTDKVVCGAVFGYGIPGVGAILGCILGYLLFKTDIAAVGFMFLGIAVGLFAVKLFSKKHKIAIKAIKKN